ncbi:adenylate kinase [Mycoplasmopsis canis UF31]|uniref:adenylate kinase family protein n=1 Tax=Mycoplasmopsis canis TaxID=29555 RepID=UPI00025ACFF2|nr:nucleoside monophosphate kinase [Mycoplasmopsis canis]EIE40836.1 adenylate kinase [Mycoplasmopsis canis UF31]EIE40962.1 adenylate kinase [Mycoplasmopsis canis UF33]EIE42111.1 adenylate kinase [Mycoplasmopsis canis UFG1]
MIKTNLIFMGEPGAGKGTVAGIIAQETNLIHLSTGNIFRNEIKNKTELGKKVEFYVHSGGYVPDEVTNEIVLNAITKLKNEGKYFILDGFPRTIAQAEFLRNQKDFDFKTIQLTVPHEVIIERLSGRRMCSQCGAGYHVKFQPSKIEGVCDIDGSALITREDDNPEKIKNRLKIYQEQTQPLLKYYEEKDELISIVALEDPNTVAKKVLEKI